jgi:hypothetical protein
MGEVVHPRKDPFGNSILIPGTPEQADSLVDLLTRRSRFVKDECVRRGWPTDPRDLSIEQILEIRKLPGWKDLKP